MARLPLRIVTPEKVSWEGEVDGLSVPAWEGSMGILPGHAPLLAQMKEGVVRIKDGTEERFLAVSGGFLEVAEKGASLFAETAEQAGEIDAERARQAAERAKASLKGSPGSMLDDQAMAALRRALVRLRVAELSKFKSRPGATPHE